MRTCAGFVGMVGCVLFACNVAAQPVGRRTSGVAPSTESARRSAAGPLNALGSPAVASPSAGSQSKAAPTREMCVTAYESVQTAMKRSTLTQAREQARICLDAACSSALRSDCATWLVDIDARQPTFVVEYRDPTGATRSDVAVFIDNAKVASVLDGRGIAVDPGPHRVRVEPAGEKPMEERHIFREGAKLEPVTFSRAPTEALKPERSPDEIGAQRPVPTSTLIAGGVGVLGAVSFATFAIWGKVGQNNLDSTCKPTCTAADVSSVHSRYVVADISLAVSIVGLASAALFYAFRPTQSTSPRARESQSLRQLRSVYGAHGRVASNESGVGAAPSSASRSVGLGPLAILPDVRAVRSGATFGIQGILP